MPSPPKSAEVSSHNRGHGEGKHVNISGLHAGSNREDRGLADHRRVNQSIVVVFVQDQTVRVEVSQTTDGVNHEFMCGPDPCNHQDVDVRHFGVPVDVSFTDTSVFPVQGNIIYAETTSCPSVNTTVCAYDTRNNGVEIECDETDEKGAYSVCVTAWMGRL